MNISENKYFIFDTPIQLNLKYIIKSIAASLLSSYYKIFMNFFHPHMGQTKKYKVAICAIFKNEAPYLKEWIEFHKIVGIEHFYLYNNFSQDKYKEILAPYVESGDVTLIDWPHKQAQMQAYADSIARFSNEVQWIGFIDLDEYIVPNKMDTVYAFLQKFEKNRPVVMMYWRVFGSSGRIERDITGLVTEDFTVCWSKYDSIGKCFFNTKYEFNPQDKRNKTMHAMWGMYNGIALPPVNLYDNACIMGRNSISNGDFSIQINHYFTKSYQEYLTKVSRGDAYFKKNPRDEEYFYAHEMLCQDVDYHAYKYLIKLKKAIQDK
ncbi:Glycosyltransferase family 92 [Propionispira arboris]|uniref:Glycosyltransferase family 92 n=1 Tax=Propionispira arboris TaxID=84035 RepID=A0A1H6TXW6_9FIRM|nr:glycosyltransferase family 92 protein [Propionispira arboris]SEI84851.1 Glycosyltransferase family 92 [Propionispira arboris]